MRLATAASAIALIASISNSAYGFTPVLSFNGAINKKVSQHKHNLSVLTLTTDAPATVEAPTQTEPITATEKSPKKKKRAYKKKRNGQGKGVNAKDAIGDTPNGTKKTITGKEIKVKNQKTAGRKPMRIPLKKLKLGSIIDGEVKEIVPFGAFVQTRYSLSGNGYALIHKSQITNDFVADLNDIFEVGQKIKARVINIDYEKGEVGLSMRPKRPPRKPLTEVEVGDEYEGRVKEITDYGAFIDIGCARDALLHISRITMDKVNNIGDYLEVGKKVTVHIIDVDVEKSIIAASMLNKVADAYLDRRRKKL